MRLRSLCCDYGKKRLCSCCYYAHYATIVPRKKINLHSNTTLTEHLSCFCYVHYAMILTQNKINLYSNTIFTTQFLIEKSRIFALRTVGVAKSFTFSEALVRKFSVFKRFVRKTVISPSGVSVKCFMLYYPISEACKTTHNFLVKIPVDVWNCYM